jgi:hypothetical protein
MFKIKVVGRLDLRQFEKKQPKLPEHPKEIKVIKAVKVTYSQQEVHFFSDRNKKIVGRLENGKIAIISFDFKGEWVKDGESWICDIIQEYENKIIVNPVKRTITAQENFESSKVKIEELKDRGFQIPFLKPKNTRLYYSSK